MAGGGSNRQLLPVVFMRLKPHKGGDAKGRCSILEPPEGGLRGKWLLILIPSIAGAGDENAACYLKSLGCDMQSCGSPV